MDIRDLGTSFNVKAYPRDKTAEATLLEGMIDVRVNKGQEGMVLTRPHQKFTVFARPEGGESHNHPDSPPSMPAANKKTDEQSFQVSTAAVNISDSLLAETAWMKNMLVFRDETFEELAIRLERWYAISIRFSDTDRVHYRFTGVLADESLEQALQVLQMMKPFHFTISGKTVHIGK
jgi:ferric-dicitrate binding protein FerR (iron transport regulator)